MKSRGGQFNRALVNSLRTIRVAKSRFRLLTACSSTQAILVSQIELCDVLLDEIRTISFSLKKRMSSCRGIGRRPVTGGIRSRRCLVIPRRDLPNRSKQQK